MNKLYFAVVVAAGASLTGSAERLVLDAGGKNPFSYEWKEARAGKHELVVTGLPPKTYYLWVEDFCVGKYVVDQYAKGVPLELNEGERKILLNKDWGSPTPADRRKEWNGLLRRIPSTLDGTLQPCYFWAPELAKSEAVPLIVGLHTWSCSYRQLDHYAIVLKTAKKRGWAFVGPNFRGPNSTPPACGGEPAVQDIVDAVNYAKRTVKIDSNRVYIIGGSGGGHMTLLMLGRHPEIFAAGSAFCPITDLARWHADSLLDHPGRGKEYATMMEGACGGKPSEKPEEYRRRSPLTYLENARRANVAAYIVTGIHDGWKGSVPVGHSFRAFNAMAAAKDRVSEVDIEAVERDQRIPDTLVSDDKSDPFYGESIRIHFRRTSGPVRLTIFEGGHGGNFAAGFEFLSRQRKGRPVDWSLPGKGSGSEEKLTR